MDKLPFELIREIYLYDSTYHDKYKLCVCELTTNFTYNNCLEELRYYFQKHKYITNIRYTSWYNSLILLDLNRKALYREYVRKRSKIHNDLDLSEGDRRIVMQNCCNWFIKEFSTRKIKYNRFSSHNNFH